MHTWPTRPAQQVLAAAAAAGALALTALALTGCSAINPQETTSIVAAVPGVRGEIGPLRVEDLVIVSGGGTGPTLDPNSPGRLAGTVFNGSSSPASVSFSTEASSPVQVTVPRNGELKLGSGGGIAVLKRTGGIPGGMTTVTISTGNSTVALKVPVVDGTLAQYRPLLPSPSSTGSSTPPSGPATPPSSTASPSATATVSETGRPSASLSITPSP